MKKIFSIFAVLSIMIFTTSCSSQSGLPVEVVSALVANKKFTFVAERANPLDGTVNNVIMNMPGAMGNRILNLDPGYELQVNENKLSVNLPYFGRTYNPEYGSRNIGFNFDSEDYVLLSSDGKKNTKNLSFTIKDQPHFKQFYLEIQPNGKAVLSINSNDRQPISYFGYITQNKD